MTAHEAGPSAENAPKGEVRVELMPDRKRGPQIEVFQVAGRGCPCGAPLNDESTTEGGW